MTVNELQSRYHSIIMTYNTSVGGTASQWGGLNTSTVTGKKPDLVFIGFGMNDGTLRVSKEKYKRNIESIISKIRQKCPDCEFVLISTMLPNEEAQGFYGEQENYLSVLNELECEGAVVADITSIHKEFLTKKRYCDMTGNNVNHPNDFLSRLYAQVMIQTICDK